jgi:cephalosporin hydroxylase
MEEIIESKRWLFAKCNSLNLQAGKPYDLIFIDSSHLLYHTLLELRKFTPWVKPGGRILLHDTEWTTVGVPEGEYMRGVNCGYGPVAWALDEFCRESDHTWFSHPGSFGLGEICL